MAALTATALKQQIEAQLAQRIPAALSPMARQQAERQPCRDAGLTDLLGGGVPLGAITELHGPACSGRTSVAFSLAAAVTTGGRVAAWVDVSDELDPETAALCGVNLEHLLWVRCGSPQQPSHDAQERDHRRNDARDSGPNATANTTPARQRTDAGSAHMRNLPTAAAHTQIDLVATDHKPKPVGNGGCGSPHPRGEGRGMAEAIDSLLQQQPRSAAIVDRRMLKKIGTPGMPNRDLTAFADARVSHSIATVLDKAGHFPTGKPGTTGKSNLVPPSEIVPTSGSLFGRQVERKVSCGSNRLPMSPGARPPMPFPNASPYREEQVATDRQPSRRAKLQAEAQTAKAAPHAARTRNAADTKPPAGVPNKTRAAAARRNDDDLWAPLDQALRTVDLLLQAGGFSLLVLDLGSVPADKAWRIPLATWFRFRAGCERSRCSLVVLAQQPCARASADLSIALERTAQHSQGDRVLTGSSIALALEQQRRGVGFANESDHYFAPQSNLLPFRKPVQSDHAATHAEAPQAQSGFVHSLHSRTKQKLWRAGTHWSLRA